MSFPKGRNKETERNGFLCIIKIVCCMQLLYIASNVSNGWKKVKTNDLKNLKWKKNKNHFLWIPNHYQFPQGIQRHWFKTLFMDFSFRDFILERNTFSIFTFSVAWSKWLWEFNKRTPNVFLSPFILYLLLFSLSLRKMITKVCDVTFFCEYWGTSHEILA